MEKSLKLIDDLIVIELERERLFKNFAYSLHKSSLAVGESSTLYHLKVLRDLVKEEYQEAVCSCH